MKTYTLFENLVNYERDKTGYILPPIAPTFENLVNYERDKTLFTILLVQLKFENLVNYERDKTFTAGIRKLEYV